MLDTLLKHLDMVRLSIAAMALVALVGCTGLIDGGSGQTLTPEQKIAQQKWLDKALPILKPNCGQCHAGSQPDIAFIAGATDLASRDTLLGFDPQIVNTDAPGSSRLMTKGAHAGPALLASQAADLLEWVQAEKDAVAGMGSGSSGGPVLETTSFRPQLCTCVPVNPGDCVPGMAVDCPINHVDLSPLGLTGATIDFVAMPLGSTDLYVNHLAVQASTDGAYIEHPLFVSWPSTPGALPIPDGIDRFFSVKLNLMATTQSAIGAGTAAFVGFAPNNKMTIHFKVLDKYKLDTGSGSGSGSGSGTVGGCKKLTEFKANAKSQLSAACGSCHTGTSNPNAHSAMNLDGVNAADDATLQLACNQARIQINFTDTATSGFYIAPNPAQATAHPFKFGGNQANFNAFKAAVDVWVQAEKTAP
ncbi:MAG: hypothetical protein JWO36_4873 [Myxococcales bacterium]|nr:hypothetical protein [Myxococcales bacterium]